MFEKDNLRNRCYKFSLSLIHMIEELPKEKVSYILADQLLRSGTSIGANLVEASGSSSRLEYKKYFEISLKSANETKYWLGLLRDSQRCNSETINKLLKEVVELSNMIGSAVIKLKSKPVF